MRLKILGLGLLLLGPLFSNTIQAEEAYCARKIGDYEVVFSIYPVLTAGERYCDHMPQLGQAAIAVDYTDRAMRSMKTSVKLLKFESWDDAQDAEKEAAGKIVAKLPSQTYPSGTVLIEHKFIDPGFYAEVLAIVDNSGATQTLRFPFKVATGFDFSGIIGRNIVYVLAGFFFLSVLGVIGFMMTRGDVTDKK